MKKIAALVFGVLLLSACGDDDTNTTDTDPVDVDVDQEVIETEDQDATVEEETKIETDADEEVIEEESENNDALTEFPEHDVLAEHIDLAVYTSEIETDNQGTRVILFENADGHKEFKSVFVKNDNRLKIIKLDDDGLLYNAIINN